MREISSSMLSKSPGISGGTVLYLSYKEAFMTACSYKTPSIGKSKVFYRANYTQVLQFKSLEKRQHSLQAFKRMCLRDNIIKPKNIPYRAFELQRDIAFEMGYGLLPITEEFIKQRTCEIISGQQDSLSEWLEYLCSEDCFYPVWIRYWVLRSVICQGKYNNEKKNYVTRDKNTTTPFPIFHAGALARTTEIIQNQVSGLQSSNIFNIPQGEFDRIVSSCDFGAIYVMALSSFQELSEEGLENITGSWICYKKGSSADELHDSLQGYPLEWCTANNKQIAQSQLKRGDFYVYYSANRQGKHSIPRIAIRMENKEITEVRGIAHKQEMDRFIYPVLEEKMKEFGTQGDIYIQRLADMRKLSEIFNRTHRREKGGTFTFLNHELSRDDIAFVFELRHTIHNFGHREDPRIELIRKEYSFIDTFLGGDDKTFVDKIISLFEEYPKSNRIGQLVIIELKKMNISKEDLQKIANVFIDKGVFNLIIKQHQLFNLNNEMGERAFRTQNDSRNVFLKSIQYFSGLSREIAKSAIKSGYSSTVMKNKDRFKSLEFDQEMALLMIRNNGFDVFKNNLYCFKGIDYNLELMHTILDVGKSGWITMNVLRRFHDLDLGAAMRFIEEDTRSKGLSNRHSLVSMLTKNPLVFSKLNFDDNIATLLIENGFYHKVVKCAKNFIGFSLDKKVAIKLIEMGESRVVRELLKDFKGLDNEIAIELIRSV